MSNKNEVHAYSKKACLLKNTLFRKIALILCFLCMHLARGQGQMQVAQNIAPEQDMQKWNTMVVDSVKLPFIPFRAEPGQTAAIYEFNIPIYNIYFEVIAHYEYKQWAGGNRGFYFRIPSDDLPGNE